MSEVKHTEGELYIGAHGIIVDKDGYSVAVCTYRDTREERDANAERIVKCWNRHGELLEALKETEVILRSQEIISPKVNYVIQEAESEE